MPKPFAVQNVGQNLFFRMFIHLYRIQKKAMDTAVQCVREGGILLIKGVGGYQYLCRPDHLQAVEKIKRLKTELEKHLQYWALNREWCEWRIDFSDEGKACLVGVSYGTNCTGQKVKSGTLARIHLSGIVLI